MFANALNSLIEWWRNRAKDLEAFRQVYRRLHAAERSFLRVGGGPGCPPVPPSSPDSSDALAMMFARPGVTQLTIERKHTIEFHSRDGVGVYKPDGTVEKYPPGYRGTGPRTIIPTEGYLLKRDLAWGVMVESLKDSSPPACAIPPYLWQAGWRCSRKAGHDGPCAMHPPGRGDA